MSRLQWIFPVLASTLYLGCVGGPRFEGGTAVDLDLKRPQCTNLSQVLVGDLPIEVRARQTVSPAQIERFGQLVAQEYQNYEKTFASLRDGLATHLGHQLFSKISDRPYLHPRPLGKRWCLLDIPRPKAFITHSGDVQYCFLPENGGLPLRLDVFNLRMEVHEIGHYILADLLAPNGRVPRWLDEGLAQYLEIHFARWTGEAWDGTREIDARLAWNRSAVQADLLRQWRGSGGISGYARAWREKSWQSDLLYSASLGLVLGIDRDGRKPGFAVDVAKKIIEEKPTSDEQVITIIEKILGKPLRTIGRLTPEARAEIFSTLETKVGRESKQGPVADSPTDAFTMREFAALGHFPERRTEALSLLGVVSTKGPCGLEAAIRGAMRLGETGLVRTWVNQAKQAVFPDECGGVVEVAEEYLASSKDIKKWFSGEFSETHPSEERK